MKNLFKKIKKEKIIVIIFLSFIFYIGSASIKPTLKAAYNSVNDHKNIQETIANINQVYESMLNFNDKGIKNKGFYINLNGFIANVLQQKEMNERVILNNGNLTYLMNFVDNSKEVANNIEGIYKTQIGKGNEFVFVLAPNQLSEGKDLLPEYFKNDDNSNEYASLILKEFDELDIPYIDLREMMLEQEIKSSDYFFKSDHHWKPELGFWAFGEIISFMENNYDFSYIDQSLLNIDEYNIDIYNKIFLGSAGKRTGKYFSGIDDFSIIYPKFNTNIKMKIESSDIEKEGTFLDVTYGNEYKNIDLFNSNPYGAYGQGDRGLIYYSNTNAPVKKSIMLVGDSFSNSSFPFFSIIFQNVYQLDMRHYYGDFTEFYEEVTPDIFLILVNPSALDTKNVTFDFSGNNSEN